MLKINGSINRLDMDVIASLYFSQSAFLRIHFGLNEVVIAVSFLGSVIVSWLSLTAAWTKLVLLDHQNLTQLS